MHRKKPLKRNRGLDCHNEHVPRKARKAGMDRFRVKKPKAPKRSFTRRRNHHPEATPAEKAHMDATAKLGCIACAMDESGWVRPCLHHIREGYGASQRASNWEVLPLDEPHHQGDLMRRPEQYKVPAFHKAQSTFKARYGNEIELLEIVWQRLGLDFMKLPELRGSEPPWWQDYLSGKFTTRTDLDTRLLLTCPIYDCEDVI